MTHDEDVWMREVRQCEDDALRAIGTPSGGRGPNESIVQYCNRVKANIDVALSRLAYARTVLARLRQL
jgi:hypothetical protein